MPGPPKKPASLKLVSGTARPDRVEAPHIELPLLEAVPPAPDWLPGPHAVNEWNRLAPILVANKLLAEADLSTLAHLCSVHSDLVQMRAARMPITGHMQAQYNALAAAFGLSAVWRSKVKPIGDKGKASAFSKFRSDPAG